MAIHLAVPLKIAFKTVFSDAWDYVSIGYNTGLILFMSLVELEAHIKFAVWFILSVLGIVLFVVNIHRKIIENKRKKMENVVYKHENLEVITITQMMSEEEMIALEKKIAKRRAEMENELKTFKRT